MLGYSDFQNKIYCEKIKKKILWFFYVNKFHDMSKIQENWSLLVWTIEFPKRCKKKKKFSTLFLCKKIRWYFICNKELKNWKWATCSFSSKIYFGMLNKKNDSIWNKKLLLKYAVLKMIEKKRKSFLQKMFVWIKNDRDNVTQ